MKSIRVDGNDLAAVYVATKHARQYCVENGEPVMVELMTYRRGHHSTSDDSTRYRPRDVKSMARQGLEPISRMFLLLSDRNLWDQTRDEELREQTREEVMAALRLAESKKFGAVQDMFRDVWSTPTPQLQRQSKEMWQHIEKHKANYAESLQRFAASE